MPDHLYARPASSSDREAPRLSRRALLALGAASVSAIVGCGRGKHSAQPDVPPGTTAIPGVLEDTLPRWSPDGTRIAFLRHTADRRHQLCLASSDLSAVWPLLKPELVSPDRPLRTSCTRGLAVDRLDWHPSGRRIAFPRIEWYTFEEGEKLPGTALWQWDIDARRADPIALHPAEYKGGLYYYRAPTWSPDGGRLAFVGEGLHGDTGLFHRPAASVGRAVEEPRPDRYEDSGFPAWSPDGHRLAFRQGILRSPNADRVECLRILSPGGKEARSILVLDERSFRQRFLSEAEASPEEDYDLPAWATVAPRISAIAWSPDGSRLAFCVTPDDGEPRLSMLCVMAADGSGAPRRVSPLDGSGYHAPVWIDERTLGAIRVKEVDGRSGFEAVRLLVATGRVGVLCALASDDVDWSPDRRQIVCAVGADDSAGKGPKGRRGLRGQETPAALTALRVFRTGL